MPWFLPAIAAGATLALARKLAARAWNTYYGQYASVDPPGFRTVARIELVDGTTPIDDILGTIAAETARHLPGPLELTDDAIRAVLAPGCGPVDVVRLARRADAYTVELTRAWTGVPLGEGARRLLACIDDALRTHQPACRVAWFARDDRAFARPFATPFDPAR